MYVYIYIYKYLYVYRHASSIIYIYIYIGTENFIVASKIELHHRFKISNLCINPIIHGKATCLWYKMELITLNF
jgi:hypothetical protein